MQITASVTGMAGVRFGESPIYIYRLTPPFDAGTSAITLIDPDTGLPGSLTPADRPLSLEFAGFDADEALELGLYYLVQPRRLTSEGPLMIQASPIAAARVVADASGSLQQTLDVPPCAPVGDYLLVACRSGDCTLQATGESERANAAWLKFLRAPAVAPGETPPPRPELARVDPVSAFDGLNLRAGPSAATAILEHFVPGGLVELTGPARQSQGAPWYPVRDPITCTEGWVNGNYLVRAAMPDGGSRVEPIP